MPRAREPESRTGRRGLPAAGSGLWLLLLAAAGAGAQDSRPIAGDPPPSAWELRLAGGAAYLLGGQLDGGNDEIDTWINRLGLRGRGGLWPGAWLDAEASYEHRHYSFDGRIEFLPGTDEPFESVHILDLRAFVLQGIAPDWGVLYGGSVSASAESGADLLDGVSWNALAGVGHQFGADFRLGVGVLLVSRFERRPLVIPALQLWWNVSDSLSFKIEGAEAEVLWDLADDWQLALGARFSNRRFRLDAGEPGFEGIVADYRIPLYLRATYRPTERVDLQLTVGLDVYREFQVENRGGDDRKSWTSDPAPFFGFGVTLRF